MLEERAWLLAAALILDAAMGDPRRLWDMVPHPAALIGQAVDRLDRTLNDQSKSEEAQAQAGIAAAAILILGGLIAGAVLAALLFALPFSWWLELLAVAILLAGRSLYDHVETVARALARDGLNGGRDAVRHVVGRDPASLDEAGVCRAAIESLAENFSDAVVAPAFWYLLLGLPGLIAYKAVNTADSMIGHKNARYLHFGRATARLDDVLNWAPARISGGLIAFAAYVRDETRGKAAIAAMKRDANRHRSVNAGWPEAAMAGALDLALAGPRAYGGERIDDAVMNTGGRKAAGIADIRAALRLYLFANVALFGLVLVLAVVF